MHVKGQTKTDFISEPNYFTKLFLFQPISQRYTYYGEDRDHTDYKCFPY